MKPAAALISVFLLLSACQTPEQIAAQREREAVEDHETCLSYGLRPGSEAFGNCRLQLDIARQQRYYNYYYDPGPRFHYGFYHYR